MKTTKKDLLARVHELERRHDPMELAICDLARGNVQWFGRGQSRIGISRPNGPHGGIVIIDNGTVHADYWETWSRDNLDRIALLVTGHDNAYNRELCRLRDLIESARKFVAESQQTAWQVA